MRKYRNSAMEIPINGEVNNGKSMTIPQQAPSMRELLQRHSLGIADNTQYNGNYTGDLPDLRGYEPHELSDMIFENKQKVAELEEIKNAQSVELRKIAYDKKRKHDLELLKQLQLEKQ